MKEESKDSKEENSKSKEEAHAEPKEHLNKTWEESKSTRGGDDTSATKTIVNYFSIHGTTPGANVAAKSSLVLEVTQHFINKTMNLRSECIVPDCFSDFRGGDNQSVVTNNTARYSLGFGLKSEFDTATEDLFK
jgi:hypothetical protein